MILVITNLRCASVALAASLTSSLNAAPPLTTTFTGSLEGWGSPHSSWQSTGGNPGGYLRLVNPVPPPFESVVAPSTFHGDWRWLDGAGVIRYDHVIFTAGTQISGSAAPHWIQLSGPGGIATWTGAIVTGATPWTTIAAPLRQSDWVVSSGTWLGLLANVTGVRIRVEMFANFGAADESGLDNVYVGYGSPEILVQPQNVSVCPGGTTGFVISTTRQLAETYRWQVEAQPPGSNVWIDLTNGPIPGSMSTARYTDTPLLAVLNVDAGSARAYRSIITNSAGVTYSLPATLSIVDRPPFALAVNPRGTWLHVNEPVSVPWPLSIDLASRNIQPGNRIHLQRLGAFSYHPSLTEFGTNLMGVFSNSNQIVSNQCALHRVINAIDAGVDVVTPLTALNAPCTTGRETDIPQDFTIDNEVPGNTSAVVTVPASATYLWISANDEYFSDNADSNGDFGVRITDCGNGTASVIPAITQACTASTVVMIANAGGCGSSFQWQYDDPNVAGNGPWLNLPETSRIVGTQTAVLAISHVSASDATAYRCIVTNVCGPVISTSATVAVEACCPGDINHDASVNVTDLITVITNWGGCPSPCPPRCAADIAPIAGDCNVNVSDLLAVITAWGPCS